MNLTLEQQKAINEINHNLQIIACAGSGKTEVITRRIVRILESNQNIHPENIVAFTFTEKAAESMKKRIEKAVNNRFDITNMYIGTIHGFCYKLLQENCKEFKSFKVLDSVKSFHFINRYYKECGMEDFDLKCYSFNINLFLSCIDKLIYDYDNRDNWDKKNLLVFEKYKNCLYKRNYFDFSLLIFETLNQLNKNINLLKNINYLIVDEYQDVDDIQEKLIKSFYDIGCNICVVGDDDQTIYRFRGSNANNMIGFASRYKDVISIKIEENFRGNKGIVDIADNVIQNNKERLEKKMISNRIDKNSCIEVMEYTNEIEQYDGIAQQIKYLHNNGISYNDIAILVRKGKFINNIANVLKMYNIPFDTDSADYFFSSIYFEKFVFTLQLLTDFSKSFLYECWNDYIDVNKFTDGFKYLRKAVNGSVGTSKLSEILLTYLNIVDFLNEDYEDLKTRKDCLQGIIDILEDFDEIYIDYQLSGKIRQLLDFLCRDASEQYKYHNFKEKDDTVEQIKIMTIHKSKGLEFNTVFIPNLEENEFPTRKIYGKKYWHVLGEYFEIQKDKYESDIEDERKLFYVALTRAKENLILSFQCSKNSVSEFLLEASESKYLVINENAINLKQSKNNYKQKNNYYLNNLSPEQQYANLIKYARNQLIDYYGTAMQIYSAAMGDFLDVDNITDEEIIEEAKRLNLI